MRWTATDGGIDSRGGGGLLRLSGQHFPRQCARFEESGVEILRDKRLGRVSERRASESELERMRRLYREEYADFTVKHFHEELHKRHGYSAILVGQLLACKDNRCSRPARLIPHRSGLTLLRHIEGRHEGGQGTSDPGQSGAVAIGHPPHSKGAGAVSDAMLAVFDGPRCLVR
jgi:hypothetical protein